MRILSIKMMTNKSKYYLNTLFIKSMKATRAFVSYFRDVTISDFELMIAGSEIYLRKTTSTLKEPFFFFTNNTGAPHGEILGLMKPLSKRSFNCSFNSLSSAGAILVERIKMGWVFGRRSISKLISLSGGTPGRSFGNTSGNSFTTRTDSRFGVSEFESLTRTR
ncbi:hypothetical protein R3W88_029588 [Solanum pinnatisectum]|uniref:Uncharacterized protein n=1 Tax=Solanum pinnatisectum TaxID=50273 RepID=A0AAV9K667_9SOLN|nr:hypothetical protein R3W88_029588 [Solanum pinnatisectum]